MLFLQPRYLKQARQYVNDARKLVAFRRDLYAPAVVEGVQREIDHLSEAIKRRQPAEVQEQMSRLDRACGAITQPVNDAAWRENVEVFLVAIVIALAVRTYFLQPFTIPTGSMQPTLNGIIGTPTAAEPPNVLVQAAHLGFYGRNYVDVVARDREAVLSINEVNRGFPRSLLTYTRIDTSANNTYWVWGNLAAVEALFKERQRERMAAGKREMFEAGEPIVRGYVDTGDHVFVDKFTYNFRPPRRGDVFVFSTHGIDMQRGENATSQYYIKRLAGLPGDTLRIDSPQLYVNGETAREPGFVRVVSGTFEQPHAGYRGYSNGNGDPRMKFLGTPNDQFLVRPKNYFALGDNSYNSADSRYWGFVPEQNVMGRAVFVYWPFGPHWRTIN